MTPIAGWRFIPGIQVRVPHEGGGYLVRTNELGFRSDVQFVRARRPGTRRLLLFGDSFTAGDGVSNGRRFGDILESLVPDLEVYNFGVPATGPDQHYLLFKRYAKEFEHDAVMIAPCVENIRRVITRYRPFVDEVGRECVFEKPYFELVQARLELRGSPPAKTPIDPATLTEADRRMIYRIGRFPLARQAFKWLTSNSAIRRIAVDGGLKERLQTRLRYQPFPEYDDPENAAWLVLRRILVEWTGFHTRPVLIAPLPLVHYVLGMSDPDPYSRRFAEVAEATGATLMDPLGKLAAHPAEERRRFFYEGDCHPTVSGHEAFAEALAPALDTVLSSQQADLA